MTESRTRRHAETRARTVVKALRWARKHEARKWRRPWAFGPAAAVVGGIVLGTGLSLAVDSLGPFDRLFEADPVVMAEAPQRKTAPAEPEAGPVEPNQRTEPVLVPAAGAFDSVEEDLQQLERSAGNGPERAPFVYEEPLDSGEPGPGPSTQVIEAAVQQAALSPVVVPEVPAEGAPAWLKNAVQVADSDDRPMIAIVIDDLGLNRVNARRSIALPPPLTLAFMSYAEGLEAMTTAARRVGHELMVHVPMEPMDEAYDAGNNVLTTGLTPDAVAERLDWALGRFEGYVGINNHMGSKFTTSPVGMAQVMAELRSRGLLFLDSKTSSDSVGQALAASMGVAHTSRNVFIDNEPEDMDSIRRQLTKLEDIARRRGKAVGIGHPHDTTLEILAQWLAEVEGRGFKLVPISAIVRHETEMARAEDGSG